MGAEAINELWRAKKIRAIGIKRAKLLVEAATNSIGVKQGTNAVRCEISMLIEDFMKKKEQEQRVIEIEAEVKESLDHLGKMRQTGPRCPRCGAVPDCYEHQQQALSRCADIQICNSCGTEEALADFCGQPKALSDWAIVKAGWGE